MVIFHCYVSLPEGRQFVVSAVLLCPIQEGCPLKSRDFLLKIPKRNIFQGPNMLNHLLREPISVFKGSLTDKKMVHDTP